MDNKDINKEEINLKRLIKESLSDFFTNSQTSSIEAKRTDEEIIHDHLIGLKEISKLFHVSLVTVHKWRKAGILPKEIKKGGRVYFIRAEVLNSIQNERRSK